jgi:hypothetical protein
MSRLVQKQGTNFNGKKGQVPDCLFDLSSLRLSHAGSAGPSSSTMTVLHSETEQNRWVVLHGLIADFGQLRRLQIVKTHENHCFFSTVTHIFWPFPNRGAEIALWRIDLDQLPLLSNTVSF